VSEEERISSQLERERGMLKECRDCIKLRYRISTLHQTWKWLHLTIAVHEFLVSLTSAEQDLL